MKVLFAGPSLYRASADLGGLQLRPPAAHGDLAQAVADGAHCIGLVDGHFEAIAAVWHKEILYAINEGVVVAGAASMGALRASECAKFGMVPIGKIANEYLNGGRDDDADVAMLHGPTDIGSPPLTDALVDVEATVSAMRVFGVINDAQVENLLASARSLFFKERNIETIVAGLHHADHLKAAYKKYFVSQKQADAIKLIKYLKKLPATRGKTPSNFQFEKPHIWTNRMTII
jgi:hypothetical protein